MFMNYAFLYLFADSLLSASVLTLVNILIIPRNFKLLFWFDIVRGIVVKCSNWKLKYVAFIVRLQGQVRELHPNILNGGCCL